LLIVEDVDEAKSAVELGRLASSSFEKWTPMLYMDIDHTCTVN